MKDVIPELSSYSPNSMPTVGSLPTTEQQWNKHMTGNVTGPGLPLFTNSLSLLILSESIFPLTNWEQIISMYGKMLKEGLAREGTLK